MKNEECIIFSLELMNASQGQRKSKSTHYFLHTISLVNIEAHWVLNLECSLNTVKIHVPLLTFPIKFNVILIILFPAASLADRQLSPHGKNSYLKQVSIVVNYLPQTRFILIIQTWDRAVITHIPPSTGSYWHYIIIIFNLARTPSENVLKCALNMWKALWITENYITCTSFTPTWIKYTKTEQWAQRYKKVPQAQKSTNP